MKHSIVNNQAIRIEEEEGIPILEQPKSVFVIPMMILSLCTKSIRFWEPLTWQT